MKANKPTRKSKMIIIPTVKYVTVNVPMMHHNANGGTGFGYTTRAHTFIKKVFGQITRRRFASAVNPKWSFKYIGRMKRLNKGTYTRSEIIHRKSA